MCQPSGLCCKKRMSRINDGRLSGSGIFLGGLPVVESNLFKWRHYESEIILLCVRWYLRYALSYRDLEEMMNGRGLSVDHTTIYRSRAAVCAGIGEKVTTSPAANR